MEIGTCIKLLKLYLELNPQRHDMGRAIQRALEEIGRLRQENEELKMRMNDFMEEMRGVDVNGKKVKISD